ncbi:hypothetical protein V1477_002886 [Vespula maculifrons]|uniref:Uncharacterized protein n=1 Tax=Vespula maculifrons TaxID=7453 RepID=A0ABD2CV15_VESMC
MEEVGKGGRTRYIQLREAALHNALSSVTMAADNYASRKNRLMSKDSSRPCSEMARKGEETFRLIDIEIEYIVSTEWLFDDLGAVTISIRNAVEKLSRNLTGYRREEERIFHE